MPFLPAKRPYIFSSRDVGLKSIHDKVVCLFLRNAHKMTRKTALNVCTKSEPVCVHYSKVNKLPYDGTTLEKPAVFDRENDLFE